MKKASHPTQPAIRNQLGAQTSPYLLQHAHNPVAWQPWGEAALQLAVQQDKPILLSIGYSACHWCHVMAHECFENADIAAQMNALFVCIKIDREERPDLDKIYQSAHHMLTQRPGGWPLTMALTPHGHAPFFAGTYFPPAPRLGLPGFGEVLQQVAAHYHQHRQQLRAHHRAFGKALQQLNPKLSDTPLPASSPPLEQAVRELAGQFDPEFGGFGHAPKFPHPTQLELLLRHSTHGDRARRAESARMLNVSLQNMAQGGLFDQLGGGFYRYSVDRQWRIPHFEKMLYDNAQLLALYSDAWLQNGAPCYRSIVAQTAAWVMREMQAEHGGYASTLDADSEGIEGKYYVWSETDLCALLSADEHAALENFYNLAGEPNFDGNWHLTINPERATPQPAPQPKLQAAQAKLLAARRQRIRPDLDDKILTAWNGMMIKGMARAAKACGVANDSGYEAWVASAQRALDFIRFNLWRERRLLAASRHGEAHLNGYLDDYAFVAEGIVELLQTDWRSGDLAFAVDLCDAMLARFEDTDLGGFFFTSHDHEKLLHRAKTGPDDAIPSGNAAAIRTLLKLGHLLGNTDYLQSAQKALQLFADALTKTPSLHGSMSLALQARQPSRIMIIRSHDRARMREWQTHCQRRAHPEDMTFAIPTQASDLPPALAQRAAPARGKIIAYLCCGLVCSPPLHSLDEIEQALQQPRAEPAQC